MELTLSEHNAVRYLVERRVISAEDGRRARAESLGGGVSNVVIKVTWGTNPGDALALKQSLPKLRVEEDWYADRERIFREVAALDFVGKLTLEEPSSSLASRWTAPRVVFEDRENFAFAMTVAPSDGANWKERLLAGHIDMDAARLVGEMLGAIHSRSSVIGRDLPQGLDGFGDLSCFMQLRIDPYHRATAWAHPDLADTIEREAQKMLPSAWERRVLAHGDFSPKNIIVNGSGPAVRAMLLDFEVAHLGNPVFDLAFMLNHLTLKAIYNPTLATQYSAAAQSFWAAYAMAHEGAAGDRNALEEDTVRQMGALLLARIDGKSPAEYITDDASKAYARQLARDILASEINSLNGLYDRLSLPW